MVFEQSGDAPRHAEHGWKDGWFVVPYEVTWRDVDAAGHVNNAVYFTFFERARVAYWFALEGAGTSPAHLGVIVARAECDFRSQLELTERIEIRTRIAAMRNSSFDFLYEVAKSPGGEIAATGRVVVVLYSWETRSKLTITDAFRQKVAVFQKEA